MDLINTGVELWRRERPDLDPSGTEVVWRVLRLGALFWDAIELAVAPHGLKPRSYSVLAVLRTHGAPEFQLPAKLLLRATYLTTGGLTNLIDRMEKTALVERVPDPADGRSILIRLTTHGREVIDRAAEDVTLLERSLAEQLPVSDRDQFAALVRTFVQRLDGVAVTPTRT